MPPRKIVVVLLLAAATGGLMPSSTAAVPTFTGPTNFTVGSNPADVVLADVNGDAKFDVVTANSGAADGTSGVTVLPNTTTSDLGPVTFGAAVALNAGPSPAAVASGDLNGDFRPDLAVANGGSAGGANGISVLLNTGGFGAAAPSFSGPTNFGAGANPASVAIGDLNKDGKADIAVANKGSASGSAGVSVLLNTTPDHAATPTFAGPVSFGAGANPASVAIGEINRDFDGGGLSRPDLVIANSGSNDGTNGVSVLLNTTADAAETPGFSGPTNFTAGKNPASIALADLNDDVPFKLDIATANSGSGGTDGVSVLLNTNAADGAATPSFGAPTHFDAGAQPAAIAASASLDFEQSLEDMVTANRGSPTGTNGVSILSNAGAGGGGAATFTGPTNLDAGANPAAVASGDLTGDGPLEIVTSNSGSATGADGLSVLLYSLSQDGRTSAACTGPPGGSQTTWSSTTDQTKTRRDTTAHDFSTRVLARGTSGEVLFDQTTANAPESPQVSNLFDAARAELEQAFGSAATYSGPSLDSSSATNGPDILVGTFVGSTATTTTQQGAFGPGTILVGRDQSVTLFIPNGCTSLNTHVHFQTFADEVHRVTVTHDATYSVTATAATVGPPADPEPPSINPEPPSDAFTLGKVERNKKKGTAKLTVNVPGPGTVDLSGKGVKPQKRMAGAGSLKLSIKATGNKKKKR